MRHDIWSEILFIALGFSKIYVWPSKWTQTIIVLIELYGNNSGEHWWKWIRME